MTRSSPPELLGHDKPERPAPQRMERDVLITTDRNLRHQQSVMGRGLAILVLPTTSWPRIQRNSDAIVRAVASIARGQYLELTW